MSFLQTLPADVAQLRQSLRQQILTVDHASFEPLALAVFRYQAAHNPVYREYLRCLNVDPARVTDLCRVPFMPISFFKSHPILTGLNPTHEAASQTLTFASSGTTGFDTSRHLVPDPDLYDAVSRRIFEQAYGPLSQVHILALLPSYLERNNSSLVYMVRQFMAWTGSSRTGSSRTGSAGRRGSLSSSGQDADGAMNFFLNNLDELTDRLRHLTEHPDGKRVLLIGVTFALLDWAESGRDLRFLARSGRSRNPNLIVMETGGMKGRRKELLREEVHEILIGRLGIPGVHSEYGMTELLSQAYSMGEGVFQPSPTLRVFLRDINDPFHIIPYKQTGLQSVGSRRTGGINVVDLANLDSCSFIETQDLGQYVDEDGKATSGEFREPHRPVSHRNAGPRRTAVPRRDRCGPAPFRVIGRFDNSDVRGCNLLAM